MALEAGTLFASFHVDTSGVDKELAGIEKRFERLGQDSVSSLGAGMRLGAALEQAGVGAAMNALGSAGARAAGQALSPAVGAALGRAFGQGITQGLGAETGAVSAAAGALGQAAARALKQALDAHSPSRVTQAIGRDFGLGLALGMAAGGSGVERAAQNLGTMASQALGRALPRAAEKDAPGAVWQAERGTQSAVSLPQTVTAALPAEWAERCAHLIASALEGVSVRMDGERVGALVTPAVSARIAREAEARRFGTA